MSAAALTALPRIFCSFISWHSAQGSQSHVVRQSSAPRFSPVMPYSRRSAARVGK
jgi:hypothetical protein